ncbi:ACT domain-containing protein [Paraburkholderia phenoliruptrix]|uniref:ACT domain-containing protein n=1 Tax=Paraburkholderia phenoliruptrix TaxID=252970 RepID=UPI001C6DECA6|nr:ACT domain-containing protein [Paraburkholderia phenoliruptrix]MBW9105085.1 ACT domain-containing protein [Paraburkholderia phenoliruptrix]MBW9129731.1 ACT domain-containing protein [Paraburkholderia ginsengiterrae]
MSERDLIKLCAKLSPVMADSVYVYCSFPNFVLPIGLPTICTISEREGLTAVVPREDAERLSLPYTFEARLITLSVHSSLEAVGFMAVVSRKLADAGIACNVIAGYYHDHILVPVERAEDAMVLLQEIAAFSNR